MSQGPERKETKFRLPRIKSLAMMKMEKNFIAVIEKGYPRQPYKEYPFGFWVSRLEQELKELKDAFKEGSLSELREEIADLSNILDYMYEKVS